jgi:hypothetical protein
MKNSIVFLFLFTATILCSFVFPWWIIAPLTMAFTYATRPSATAGFTMPFLSIFLAWAVSIYFIDNGSVQTLLGQLFRIPAFMTPLVASLLGGFVAGLFGCAGSLIRPKKSL